MRCYCNMPFCRKFIGGTQGDVAFDELLVVDPEDASQDIQPIMVTENELDAAVKAILDWRVGVGVGVERDRGVLLMNRWVGEGGRGGTLDGRGQLCNCLVYD